MSDQLHDLPPGFEVPPKREWNETDLTRQAMHAMAYGIYVIGSTGDGKGDQCRSSMARQPWRFSWASL